MSIEYRQLAIDYNSKRCMDGLN